MSQKQMDLFKDGRSHLDKHGHEILDPRPVALPVGFKTPETIQQMIRRLVTDPAIRAELDGKDLETFEEADDFDVPDDLPVSSPYEDQFDPLHISTREQEIRSGTVADRSPEVKAKAAELVGKVKAHLSKRSAGAPQAPAADSPPVHTT